MRSLSLVLLASTSIFFAAGGSGPVFAASAASTQGEATIPSSVTAAPSANDEAQTPATPQVAPGLPQKLQDTITTKIADASERKEDRTAVQGFYTQRNFQPIWIENGALTAGAKSAIDVLRGAKSEGLDPADYPTPDISAQASED